MKGFCRFSFEQWLLGLKTYHVKARVQKPYPSYDQSGQNQLKFILDLVMTKAAGLQYPLRLHAAHTYIAQIREYTPEQQYGMN